MQPRDPCRPWRGTLASGHKPTVHFQGKPLNIMVMQVYVLTSNAKEAEVEWFYEDLLLQLLSCFSRVRPHRQQPIGSTVPGILQARTLELVARNT